MMPSGLGRSKFFALRSTSSRGRCRPDRRLRCESARTSDRRRGLAVRGRTILRRPGGRWRAGAVDRPTCTPVCRVVAATYGSTIRGCVAPPVLFERSDFAPAIANGQEAIDEFAGLVLRVEGPRFDLAFRAAFECLDHPALLVNEPDVTSCESAPPAIPPSLHKIGHACSIVHSFDSVKRAERQVIVCSSRDSRSGSRGVRLGWAR